LADGKDFCTEEDWILPKMQYAHCMKNATPKTVVVSGGFDPIHIGHIRMMQEARALGDRLVVILNNDNWLTTKKGYSFMPEKERAEIIAAFAFVDGVVITEHDENDADRSVSRELEKIKPDIFANGGDRRNADEIPESVVCKKNGIEMLFNIGFGGKVQSSSWLTAKIKQNK
jgi:cytidyltransferase-like protein